MQSYLKQPWILFVLLSSSFSIFNKKSPFMWPLKTKTGLGLCCTWICYVSSLS
jgi:hypothetical protein